MHYHDKKTPYTTPDNYRDIDGNMRTFTHVDHDKKTTISVPDNGTDPKTELIAYRSRLVEKILTIPAVYCPVMWADFRLVGEAQNTIEWNKVMLEDDGLPLDRLIQLYTLASNIQELNNSHRV